MRTTSNFDITQTAFLFSWISNSAVSLTGTETALAQEVESKLKKALSTFGTQLGGGSSGWQITWGPGVFSLSSQGQSDQKSDNTAFVVYNDSLDMYVVAIAGTNPKSTLDFLVEDGEVDAIKDLVNWQGFDPLGAQPTSTSANPKMAQISLSTATGLWALASQLQQVPDSPSTESLGEYLKNLNATNAKTQILFTGHSLGGALAPTLARWFKENSSFQGITTAMPIAGPTAGNATYQTGWNTKFLSSAAPGTINEGNIVNRLNYNVKCKQDLVPYAWSFIYKIQQLGSYADDLFYFKDSSRSDLYCNGTGQTIGLDSKMGTLVPGDTEKAIAIAAETNAFVADYASSLLINAFDCQFPMDYIDDNGNSQSFNPCGYSPCDVTTLQYCTPGEFETYFKELALVHVWSYGQDAFNIDFSVFQELSINV